MSNRSYDYTDFMESHKSTIVDFCRKAEAEALTSPHYDMSYAVYVDKDGDIDFTLDTREPGLIYDEFWSNVLVIYESGKYDLSMVADILGEISPNDIEAAVNGTAEETVEAAFKAAAEAAVNDTNSDDIWDNVYSFLSEAEAQNPDKVSSFFSEIEERSDNNEDDEQFEP